MMMDVMPTETENNAQDLGVGTRESVRSPLSPKGAGIFLSRPTLSTKSRKIRMAYYYFLESHR